MPNWAYGTVKVTGTREGVKSFIERFSSREDAACVSGKRHFARSVLDRSRQECIDNVMYGFPLLPPDGILEFTLIVDFAWSARHCLIQGYPQEDIENYLTLSEACKEDHVSAEIYTTEPSMCLEEHISATEDGTVNYKEHDMSLCKCRHCGETIHLSCYDDPSDFECPNCGRYAIERCKEDEV